MSETTHTPEPTDHLASDPTTDVATSESPKRSRGRTLLLTGGAVVTAALLAGGGVAIGAAIADEGDDLDDASLAADGDDRRGDSDTGSADDDVSGAVADDATGTDDDATAGVGSASAAELSEVVATAATIAEGDAVGIDAERDGGWEVSFETAAGDETEVRVAADGTPTVISTEAADADDEGPQGTLDAATVDALVASALAEIEGTVTDIDIDEDATSPYDISVLTRDGRSVDIEIDAQMTVLSVDRD